MNVWGINVLLVQLVRMAKIPTDVCVHRVKQVGNYLHIIYDNKIPTGVCVHLVKQVSNDSHVYNNTIPTDVCVHLVKQVSNDLTCI